MEGCSLMNVTGFNHVTIRVKNLKRSLAFYQDRLGMKLVHLGRTDAYLSWGEAWVCLIEIENAQEHSKSRVGIDHIAFTIDEKDFPDAVERLKKGNVPIVREPVERGGGYSVQFLDPDSTVLELFTGNLEKRMRNWK